MKDQPVSVDVRRFRITDGAISVSLYYADGLIRLAFADDFGPAGILGTGAHVWAMSASEAVMLGDQIKRMGERML